MPSLTGNAGRVRTSIAISTNAICSRHTPPTDRVIKEAGWTERRN